VHISTIARTKQQTLERVYKINDKLVVKVVAVDRETGRIRLVAPDLEKP
jgi:ribosomal protein S1